MSEYTEFFCKLLVNSGCNVCEFQQVIHYTGRVKEPIAVRITSTFSEMVNMGCEIESRLIVPEHCTRYELSSFYIPCLFSHARKPKLEKRCF